MYPFGLIERSPSARPVRSGLLLSISSADPLLLSGWDFRGTSGVPTGQIFNGPYPSSLPFSRFLIDPSKMPGPLRRVAGQSVFNGVFRISVRPPPHGSSLLDTRIFYRSPVCPYESWRKWTLGSRGRSLEVEYTRQSLKVKQIDFEWGIWSWKRMIFFFAIFESKSFQIKSDDSRYQNFTRACFV